MLNLGRDNLLPEPEVDLDARTPVTPAASLRQRNLGNKAVRLALAMGEVVQRVGTAFFLRRDSTSDFLGLGLWYLFAIKEVPFPCLICDDILSPDIAACEDELNFEYRTA